MAQKYEWGWIGYFEHGGALYDEKGGYLSKAEVLQAVQKLRAEEKQSLKDGFQSKETLVRYVIRRRPAFVIPDWEAVAG